MTINHHGSAYFSPYPTIKIHPQCCWAAVKTQRYFETPVTEKQILQKKMLRGLFQGFFFMAVNMSFYLTSDSTLCCNCTIYKCGHWRLNPRRTPSGWTYFLWWSNICGQCVSNTSASVKYPNMCVCNICLLSAKHLPYSMCIGLMSVKVVKSVWRLLYIRIHGSWSLCVLKYWVQTYGDTHMGLHL